MQIIVNGESVLDDSMTKLRDIWEETSFQLEKFQTDIACVEEERLGLKNRVQPPYNVTFDVRPIDDTGTSK